MAIAELMNKLTKDLKKNAFENLARNEIYAGYFYNNINRYFSNTHIKMTFIKNNA